MRMLVRVTLPVEPFNTYVRDGSASAKMGRILGDLKPEAAYFTEFDGQRTALLVIHMDDCSQIPVIAEPWFLTFNAECHFKPVMVADDLAKADLPAPATRVSPF